MKVLPQRAQTEGFFGLDVANEDGGPAIVVNADESIGVERRIFSLAYELGRLIMRYGAPHEKKPRETEEMEHRACDFAGRFLVPANEFNKPWEETSEMDFVDRV